MKYIIGDGMTTSLWFDNWHPHSPLADTYGERFIYDLGMENNARVDVLINNLEWRIPTTQAIGWRPIIEAIPSNSNPKGQKDEIFWLNLPNQRFLVKVAWEKLRIHHQMWCEARDHMVMKPIIKIEIWSRKAEIGLIGVWHNGNLPQGTNTIGLSRMTPRSQLIFDKSDSVRSKTEECKNNSHTLKLKNSEVIIIKAAQILAYMSLNSSWKLTLMDPLCGLKWGPLKIDRKP